MALLQTHHIGNDAAVLAAGIGIDLRASGARIMAPAVRTRILTRSVPDIAGLGINNVLFLLAWTAAELRR
jgi:hypothetical protein